MRRGSNYIWDRLIHIRGVQSMAVLLVTGGIFVAIAVCLRLPFTGVVDLDATQDLQQWRNPFLDYFFFFWTFVGNSITLVCVCGLVAAVYWGRGHRKFPLIVLLSLLALPFNNVLKYFVDRPRPSADQVQILLDRSGLSFPSGHSMGSAVVYGLFASLVWLTAKPGTKWRYLGTLMFASIPCLIAASRVYVGAHWLSDVVAGLAAGAFLLVPLVALYKHWHRVTPKEEDGDTRLPDKLNDGNETREAAVGEHGSGLSQPRPSH